MKANTKALEPLLYPEGISRLIRLSLPTRDFAVNNTPPYDGYDGRCARNNAVAGISSAQRNYVRNRTREYIQEEEESIERFFSRMPKSEQVAAMQEIIPDLWRLLRRRDADSFGASVRPGDLYSGVHLRDFLQPISTAPHFWRLITLEGLACGALLFERDDHGVAVVLPNALWDGDFNNRTGVGDTLGEISTCLRARAEPYPPTLPDAARWAGSGR